ncbi:MAG: Ldh family oxidoreductase [Candidatus Woesearchaeota archaeon]
MKVKYQDLKDKVSKGVKKLGYTGEDAQVIVDTLLYAELRGNNQGIPKIATGGVPKAEKVEEFRITKKNKCGVLLSGGHPMPSTFKAATMAVELAKEHGVGVVGLNRTHASSGAIGYFARQISKAGYIGFISVGNGSFDAVAPHNSSQGVLGTNPFAYAFPYEGGEVVFDTATAAIAYFGVVEAMLKGEKLPEGLCVNAKGEDTTNPKDVIHSGDGEEVKGAIKTFAGHKGFGLSLFVQLMGSAFTLSGIVGSNQEDGSGTFVLAIDPTLLAGDEYLTRATNLVKLIKSAKPIEGKTVVLPGELGDRKAKQVETSGEIDIAQGVWDKLCQFVDG